MSLVAFKAQNHPQQVVKDDVDDRWTPAELFDPLHEQHRFTLDAAASPENAKCAEFYTIERSGLGGMWAYHRVWCNPPYSSIGPWVAKAWYAMLVERAELVVMLLPANRTEQRWWQEHIEPWRDSGPRLGVQLSVRFLPGRLRFHRPGWTPGPKGNRPPFGCCLVTWERAR